MGVFSAEEVVYLDCWEHLSELSPHQILRSVVEVGHQMLLIVPVSPMVHFPLQMLYSHLVVGLEMVLKM